jgi:hypothetical protein
MRAAALMLVGLVLCVIEWGSCFSNLPSNQNDTYASRHNNELDLIRKKMSIELEKTLQERFGTSYSLPSNTGYPSQFENDMSSTKTPYDERNVDQRDEYLGESREPRELNKRERTALEPSYESFHELQNSSGFVDKTNFIILFIKEL